jgi:hypothetical protein
VFPPAYSQIYGLAVVWLPITKPLMSLPVLVAPKATENEADDGWARFDPRATGCVVPPARAITGPAPLVPHEAPEPSVSVFAWPDESAEVEPLPSSIAQTAEPDAVRWEYRAFPESRAVPDAGLLMGWSVVARGEIGRRGSAGGQSRGAGTPVKSRPLGPTVTSSRASPLRSDRPETVSRARTR